MQKNCIPAGQDLLMMMMYAGYLLSLSTSDPSHCLRWGEETPLLCLPDGWNPEDTCTGISGEEKRDA
jgi:hypothetical protein